MEPHLFEFVWNDQGVWAGDNRIGRKFEAR